MTRQPLGIADVLDRHAAGMLPDQHPALDDHWYWCRVEHSNGVPHGAEHVNEPTYGVCVRVGPFMTEREANRLSGRTGLRNMDADSDFAPLGMEVES